MIPNRVQFAYDFQEGKPWLYEDLFAPNDFAILKSEKQISKEKEEIQNKLPWVFDFDSVIYKESLDSIRNNILSLRKNRIIRRKIKNLAEAEITTFLENGVVGNFSGIEVMENQTDINLNQNNVLTKVDFGRLTKISQFNDKLSQKLVEVGIKKEELEAIQRVVFQFLKPHVFYNETLTEKIKRAELDKISLVYGFIPRGIRIISKGDKVEGENFQKLNSLKRYIESDSQLLSSNLYTTIGYMFVIGILVFLLIKYLLIYRETEFSDSSRLSILLVNIIFSVGMVKLCFSLDIDYIKMVPMCIVPFIIKNFFDFRLAVITHTIAVIIASFMAPNPTEFIVLHISAGLTVVISTRDFYKRVNFFISVLVIVFTYILIDLSFNFIYGRTLALTLIEGTWMYLINGLLCLFVLPLVYIYEKVFRLTSDTSLLEWADTNNKLLKDLAEKAPGSFQHSLQVANLAEAVCMKIGAKSLLARTGALYHDIGKVYNPAFFTENQIGSHNPHDELTPLESAQVIVNHVKRGIELAKKGGLPDLLIDFIRTHHGRSTVYYFLKQEEKLHQDNPNYKVNVEDFSYPGPLPFSKETAVVMMCDAAEAASKSLDKPTEEEFYQLIDKVIERQVGSGQMNNAPISLREIEIAKKVLTKKIIEINHLRIAYPD